MLWKGKCTQTKPSFVWPLSAQMNKSGLIKSGASIFTFQMSSHDQMWNRKMNIEQFSPPTLLLRAASHAEAKNRCHNNKLPMLWKIKQINPKGRGEKKHHAAFCASVFENIYISPAVLHHNISNWHYQTVSCNGKSISAVVYMHVWCLTHSGASGPDACFGKQTISLSNECGRRWHKTYWCA